MTSWQPEVLGGHAPFCAHPWHSLATYCAADPAEPDTLEGKPSKAWLADHPTPSPRYTLTVIHPDGAATPAAEYDLRDMRVSMGVVSDLLASLEPGQKVIIERIK